MAMTDPEGDDILWQCPVCGDQGSISNWQSTLWDFTHKGISH
jgi:RNA polymerase subunit RPABC4/transcription elongation factor Spt4